jgi:hypothetical protein
MADPNPGFLIQLKILEKEGVFKSFHSMLTKTPKKIYFC